MPARESGTYVPEIENIAPALETKPGNHTVNPECLETAQLVQPVSFETVMPQEEARSNEQRQIVFEEPIFLCHETRIEADEQRFVSDKRGPEPLRENTVDYLSREKDRSAALKSNLEKILSYVKLMKYVSALIQNPRENIEVTRKSVETHTVIRNPDSILRVPPRATPPSNQSAQLGYQERSNTSAEQSHCSEEISEKKELSTDAVQNAVEFQSTNNNLSIEGFIDGKRFSFLVDTGANVSAIKADTWKQLPAPTTHPPEPTIISKILDLDYHSISVLNPACQESLPQSFPQKHSNLNTPVVVQTGATSQEDLFSQGAVFTFLFIMIWKSVMFRKRERRQVIHKLSCCEQSQKFGNALTDQSKELQWLLRKHEREKLYITVTWPLTTRDGRQQTLRCNN